uniref:EGF-like domain-containing protein n=1 Tax=Parastrongyloides trichosuri TaxID=131310 RepID=A0A0N4ZKS8_PARTI
MVFKLFCILLIFLLISVVSSLWINEEGSFYDKELDKLIPYCNPMGGKWSKEYSLCLCYGHYTGLRCEFVSKCLHGQLINGHCDCAYGWGGDLCNKIQCYHGTPISSNKCVCKKNFGGMYCDSCIERGTNGPPNCILNSDFYLNFVNDNDEMNRKMEYFLMLTIRILICLGVLICLILLKQTVKLIKEKYILRNIIENDALDSISISSERSIIKKKIEEMHGIKFPPSYDESENKNLLEKHKNIYLIPDETCGPPCYNDAINVKT